MAVTLADQYRDAAARVVAAEAERDEIIVAAHAAGASTRALGRELGVTHEMVRKILQRAHKRSQLR